MFIPTDAEAFYYHHVNGAKWRNYYYRPLVLNLSLGLSQYFVWTTLWSDWQTRTQRRRLQSTNPRTRFVVSTVAQWLPLPTRPSSAHRRLRNFVTSLFKALTLPSNTFASPKFTCTADVSSNQVCTILRGGLYCCEGDAASKWKILQCV